MLAKFGRMGTFVVMALVAALVPVAAFAQATPIPPGDLITDAGEAMATVISATQITYVILAAVAVSLGLWLARRGLKMGR